MKEIKLIVVVLCGLVSGCASLKPEVIKEYVDRPVEIKVPVYRNCLTKEQIPEEPPVILDTVDVTSDNALMEALKAARIDRIANKAYVRVSQELLKACAK